MDLFERRKSLKDSVPEAESFLFRLDRIDFAGKMIVAKIWRRQRHAVAKR
jgi:hypothetical protein